METVVNDQVRALTQQGLQKLSQQREQASQASQAHAQKVLADWKMLQEKIRAAFPDCLRPFVELPMYSEDEPLTSPDPDKKTWWVRILLPDYAPISAMVQWSNAADAWVHTAGARRRVSPQAYYWLPGIRGGEEGPYFSWQEGYEIPVDGLEWALGMAYEIGQAFSKQLAARNEPIKLEAIYEPMDQDGTLININMPALVQLIRDVQRETRLVAAE